MRVRELADYLRDDHNFDIALDQYMLPAGPADGWPHWSEAQVREADYVLVVSTARYCCHYELRESPRIGLGSVCEARLIHQELYNAGGMNEKFRVIHFVEDENEHVPDTLQAYHRYRLYETASKNEMIAWLHGQSSDRRFAAAAARRVIAWPPLVQKYVWGMADRKEITVRFESMLCGKSARRILTISAESNYGKTHLLAELKCYAQRAGIALSLLDCKGCPPLSELFELLSVDLGLGSIAARSPTLIQKLQQLTAPALLIFDTYEKASGDSQKWIESQLLSRIDKSSALAVVIAGQAVPDRTRYAWANSCDSVVLNPIKDGGDWHEHSKRQGMRITLEEAHLLASAGKGMPGLIQVLLENVARDKRPEAAGASAR